MPSATNILDILPASQSMGGENWYVGTADAVHQNIDIIDSYHVDYIVVLAGDHIYKMDYEMMLQQHVDTGADVTIGCLTVPREEASAFGVMDIDATSRITAFMEKPADPPGTPDDPDVTLASMGIYVFNWKFLRELLLLEDAQDTNSSHDFGHDLIPHIVKNGKAVAHRFSDSCVKSDPGRPTAYWRDVGTVDAFWKANIDLTDFTPELDLWDQMTGRSGPIRKRCRRPSSSMTRRRPAGLGRSPRWSRADASFRGPRSAIRCCSPWCTPIPSPCSIIRWCCPM